MVCHHLAITLYFSNKERKQIDRLKVKVNFCLVICLFNQSKNNGVIESKTGYFRGHVGFGAKTKAKDLSFEAKAMDFKICPRGQGHPRGLYLC